MPSATEAAKNAYCGIFRCLNFPEGQIDNINADHQAPPLKRILTDLDLAPTARSFAFSDLATFDGLGTTSGTVRDIRLSIVDNKGERADAYVVQWIWSSSGGIQHGSQAIIIGLKSYSGTILAALKYSRNHSQCYYSENKQIYDGELSIPAPLIAGIEVSVGPAESVQGGC